MSNRVSTAWIVCILAGCLILCTAYVLLRSYWLDGPINAGLELAIGQTEYSHGYREYKFRRIHVGMSGNEVKSLLGLPLRKRLTRDAGEELWFYTSPKVLDRSGLGAGCCYTKRYICLSNGVVMRVEHRFNVD